MNRYKSIFFCTAEPTKDAGNLKQYFIDNCDFFAVYHFLPGYSSEASYLETYSNGKIQETLKFDFFIPKNVLLKNISYYFYFNYILIRFLPRKSFVIVNAPIFLIFNSLSSFLKLHKFVFWVGDYYPQKSFQMKIYNKIVDYYNKNLEYVLYLSPRLEKLYAEKRAGKFYKTVSLGINKEHINRKDKVKSKIMLGFIGIIRPSQGLDLLFSYLRESNNCILEIVGNGYSLSHYKKLAKELSISSKVKFYGKVEALRPIFKRWDIGVALYENNSDNLSVYCEPTKIKNYLSFGLPIITTKTTYFYKEIEKYKAGMVIEETISSLAEAVDIIVSKYSSYIKGAENLAQAYEYSNWYSKKLKFLEI